MHRTRKDAVLRELGRIAAGRRRFVDVLQALRVTELAGMACIAAEAAISLCSEGLNDAGAKEMLELRAVVEEIAIANEDEAVCALC